LLILPGFDIGGLTKTDVNSWHFIISIIFLTLIISTVNTINFLAFNWKEAFSKAAEHEVNAAKSKQLAAETELQVLRLQLDLILCLII
jgi:Tfp pilus assembly protein PilO